MISRYGMIAMASSLDCVGIFTKHAEDAAHVMAALGVSDVADATCFGHPDPDSLLKMALPDRPLRIAVADVFSKSGGMSEEVLAQVERAVSRFAKMGAVVHPVTLPSPEEALASYCVLSAAEVASNMARLDGVRFGKRSLGERELVSMYGESRASYLGEEVKRRILFGTYMLSQENRPLYYDGACRARERISRRLRRIFREFDLILSPATPTAAFPIGSGLTPLQRRNADLCAVYASPGGLPTVSVPFGNSEDVMPLAVHLTAAPFMEGLLLGGVKILVEGEA
jgi:aspartyl-tRNA(Asn)/glutamyl-tRNA(Gln) amidotransferase subunit A